MLTHLNNLTLVVRIVLSVIPVFMAPAIAHAKSLFDISLEELMNIEVTSVAKKEQKLGESAAAVFVLTQDDIRRSGATSIPEVLRLVPGVEVASIDANKWAVSIRGFNSRFASKLLVLIDGRSVYNQQFSGVRWSQQNVVLEDVDRIEVIRGPGGTLWGANAFTGIINIITKPAVQTQGVLLAAGAGSHEQDGVVRYGGTLGDQGHYRVYAKRLDRNPYDTASGDDAYDGWDVLQGGFRADWATSEADQFTLQADSYTGEADQSLVTTQLVPTPGNTVVQDNVDMRGGNILFNWRHQSSATSQWMLKAYLDRIRREEAVLISEETTYDVELQHRFDYGKAHEITWGMGYRRISDENTNSFTFSLTPANRVTDLYSFFVQDEYLLADDLWLTAGSKFEHNDFTGLEIQPSARLLWKLDEQQTLWTALSRAVSTPSRALNDSRVNVTASPGPVLIANLGNSQLKAEEVISLELGYRNSLRKDVTVDSTVFYNRYDDLLTAEANPVVFETVPAPPHTLVSATYGNGMQGEGYGLEINLNWQATPDWRLSFAYSRLQLDLELEPGSTDTISVARAEGRSPRHQWQLHSGTRLSDKWEYDLFLYYVDDLPAIDIPAYTRVDMRFGWQPYHDLSASLVVRNLQDERHKEFVADDVRASEVPRSIYLQAGWQF